MKQIVVLIACLLASALAGAQVYKVVDEHGKVTYTDKPPTGEETAEEVDVPTTNTAPPPGNAYPKPPPPPKPAPAPSYSLKITAPADQTIIPRGPGNFSVAATVSPSLQKGHKLQLLLDGAPRQEPQQSPSWDLTNVFRGEHKLSVAVVDKDGKQLSTSEAVTVYVFRPSVNDSNRGPPVRPTPTPRN